MDSNREFDLARFIVEKTNYNLFLTGKAGTGKTTFLRDVTKHTKKKFVVLAPTGIAAINAGAMTIHSFFQFNFGPYVKGYSVRERRFNMRKNKLEMIRKLEMIIIDEISMVRADVMDHINDDLQRIRRNDKPFGGVQLIMIGDLQQLPPVTNETESELLGNYYRSFYFFDSKAFWNSQYCCIELKKVYRQDEQHFIDLLNRTRVGRPTSRDIAELNRRYQPSFQPEQDDNYIRLVTHNYKASDVNERELAALQSPSYNFNATYTSGFSPEMFPTSVSLTLKKGAQVMFLRNDPDRCFINGSIGTVINITENSITVRLASDSKEINVKQMTWEDIRYKLNEETNAIESEVKGTFKQYPLQTAWAITIHKSQGLTFDKAIIDARAAFAPGQAYVALSRCRSLNGLVLSTPVTASIFMTDSLVNDFLDVAIQDTDTLAGIVGYVPFDYDRSADAEQEKKTEQNKAITPGRKNKTDKKAKADTSTKKKDKSSTPAKGKSV